MKKIAIILSLIVSVSAQTDYSLSFDGNDDYISVTDKSLDLLGDKTVSVWVKPNSFNLSGDATNDLGEQVGAGVYLYQLQAKDFVKTRKMVLLK